MRAINHALTGAIIGLTVAQPAIAVPAAVLSHLACDMIPHYGDPAEELNSFRFKFYLVLDALLCTALVIILFLSGSRHWLLASICAFAAASPDFIAVRRFVAALHHQAFQPSSLERFLKRIQWFERPVGAVVEATWFVVGIVFVTALV